MMLWIRDLIDRVDAMSLRERILVLVALLGVILLAWYQFLMQPLERAGNRRKPEIVSLREEVDRLNTMIESLAKTDHEDPDKVVREDTEKARKGIATIDARLGGLTSGLIPPRDMVEVLRQVLNRTPPLQLVSFKTLPAEPLAALVPGAVLPARIYRHGVQMDLSGTYMDLVTFLHALQQLPVQFYWEDLELDVTEHPMLSIRITVHTLGQEEAWLGV